MINPSHMKSDFLIKVMYAIVSKYKIILALYILIQVIFIFFFPQEYRSDALYYFKLAEECYQSDQFYPAVQNLYEDYLVAPFYINIIILLLHIYNSTITISLFNLLVNLLQLFFIYKITQNYFDEKTARISLIIYILYLNTLGLVLLNYSELFFTLLIVSSIFFYSKNSILLFTLSGVLLGASIGVRPAGWALLISYLIISVYHIFKEKKLVFKPITVIAGMLFFILLFGSFNYFHFGKFIFTATTGPVNLLLGANETATGGFNARVYDKGNAGYIAKPDTMTFTQTGEFYQKQATNWIKVNTIKWIGLAPLKILHTFGYDDIAISSLAGTAEWNITRTIKFLTNDRNMNDILPTESIQIKVLYFVLQIVHHIYYFLLIIILILWLINNFKKKLFTESSLIHLLFVLIGTIMIMITVGSPRYKYPFVIVMIPFIASYLQSKLLTKNSIE